MDSSKNIRIELTPEQKAKVRDATGKEAEAVELSVEELEERIAPDEAVAPRLTCLAAVRAPVPHCGGRRSSFGTAPRAAYSCMPDVLSVPPASAGGVAPGSRATSPAALHHPRVQRVPSTSTSCCPACSTGCWPRSAPRAAHSGSPKATCCTAGWRSGARGLEAGGRADAGRHRVHRRRGPEAANHHGHGGGPGPPVPGGDRHDQRRGVSSTIMATAMVAGGITVGAIQVVNKRTGTGVFDERDRELLEGLAAAAASSLRNAQLHGAERRARDLAVLLEISREITATLDLDRVLHSVVNLASRALPFDRGGGWPSTRRASATSEPSPGRRRWTRRTPAARPGGAGRVGGGTG